MALHCAHHLISQWAISNDHEAGFRNLPPDPGCCLEPHVKPFGLTKHRHRSHYRGVTGQTEQGARGIGGCSALEVRRVDAIANDRHWHSSAGMPADRRRYRVRYGHDTPLKSPRCQGCLPSDGAVVLHAIVLCIYDGNPCQLAGDSAQRSCNWEMTVDYVGPPCAQRASDAGGSKRKRHGRAAGQTRHLCSLRPELIGERMLPRYQKAV